jgi:Protein of unknown function (DUF2800)
MKDKQTQPGDERQGGTSASNAPYDALCEGRHLAQKDAPQEVGSNDWSEFGTAVHQALATGDTSKLDGEQLSIVESCTEIEQQLVKSVFGAEPPTGDPIRERRFTARVRDRKNEKMFYHHSGKPDVVYRSGPKLLIIEYKALPGDQQSSPENLQLRDQAVLAFRNLIATEVFTAVIQPLVTHSPELCRYDRASLEKAEIEMCDRVRASNNPTGRTPGLFQCKFCRATIICKPYATWAASQLPADVKEPWETVMAEWTPEQKARAAERLPVMKKLIEDCNKFLKQSLKDNPESIPGFGLTPGDVRSTVTDPEALFGRFVELGGTLDQFMKCVSITKKSLEAEVRATTKLKGKALWGKLDELMTGLVEVKQSEPSLEKKKS